MSRAVENQRFVLCANDTRPGRSVPRPPWIRTASSRGRLAPRASKWFEWSSTSREYGTSLPRTGSHGRGRARVLA